MNYHRFFLILIARWKIILFTLLATVMTTLVVSLLLPNNYRSTATVLVTTKGPDPVSGVAMSAPMMASYLATQLDVIRSTQTRLMVVDQLKLDQSDIAKSYYQKSESNLDIRNWLANSLVKNLYLDVARDSTVIHINYTSTDAEFASAVANAFAYAYQEINVRLTAEPSQKAASYFTEQLNDLRSKVEIAQKKLTQYRDEKGIIDADLRLDVETKRLNDLSFQLVNAETGLIGGSNQNDEATSIARDPIITSLKVELSHAESKFSEIAQKYGRNHPSYKGASAEVGKLRSELNNHLRSTNKNSASLISELRAALEVQRNKVLTLNRSRDELQLLTREVESAQQAYNSAMQRLNQTDLEGKSNLSSVSILDTAKVPDKPDSPKILLNVLVSIFLGTLLGLSVALIIEMVDQRVRSAEDLVDVFQAPVLGVVQWGKPKQKGLKLNSWLSLFQTRNLTSK
ncbi:MAG: chain length determinant protein EpsF [Nitrosomonas sp.]